MAERMNIPMLLRAVSHTSFLDQTGFEVSLVVKRPYRTMMRRLTTRMTKKKKKKKSLRNTNK